MPRLRRHIANTTSSMALPNVVRSVISESCHPTVEQAKLAVSQKPPGSPGEQIMYEDIVKLSELVDWALGVTYITGPDADGETRKKLTMQEERTPLSEADRSESQSRLHMLCSRITQSQLPFDKDEAVTAFRRIDELWRMIDNTRIATSLDELQQQLCDLREVSKSQFRRERLTEFSKERRNYPTDKQTDEHQDCCR